MVPCEKQYCKEIAPDAPDPLLFPPSLFPYEKLNVLSDVPYGALFKAISGTHSGKPRIRGNHSGELRILPPPFPSGSLPKEIRKPVRRVPDPPLSLFLRVPCEKQ